MMAVRTTPVRLVIFDCDGVLVDSELIASRITAAALTRLGWAMDAGEAHARFLGMTLTDMVPVIEARVGPLPPQWKESLMRALTDALGREATAVPGAVQALHATAALGLAWRIASNSSHEEMGAKFAGIGISALVVGRVHSHRDVGRGKPAPELFLATAAAEGVSPRDCVVVEDSVVGARAAAAAGMDCLAYVPEGDGAAMLAVGAHMFRRMQDLPTLLAQALRVVA